MARSDSLLWTPPPSCGNGLCIVRPRRALGPSCGGLRVGGGSTGVCAQVATWELVAAIAGLEEILREEGDAEAPPLLTPPRVSLQAAPAGCGFSARDPPRAQVHLFVDSAVALGTILRGSSRRGLGRCPYVREVRSRAYVGSEIGMIWSPTCGSVLPRRDWVRDAPQARWRGRFRRE